MQMAFHRVAMIVATDNLSKRAYFVSPVEMAEHKSAAVTAFECGRRS
jgi:hypothetical protein